jgi:hypothetical protein
MPDNSRIIIAEHNLVSESCFTDFRTALTTCNYSFYYNDIFIIKISESGEMLWKIRIPKRQMSRNDYGTYSSFALGIFGKKLALIYNDNPRNVVIQESKGVSLMSDLRRAVVTLVEVDEKGRAEKSILFENRDRKTWLR